MALTNAYLSVAEFDAWLSDPQSAADVPTKELVIGAACRAIDGWCQRFFYQSASATARQFVAPSSSTNLVVPDISTTTGLVVVDGGTTLTSSDYQLEPLSGAQTFVEQWPYTSVRRLSSWWTFPTYEGQSTVTVTARWGWASVPIPVKMATFVLAQKFFKLKDAPLGVAGFGDFGSIRVQGNRDVEMMLQPYVRAEKFGLA